VLIIRISLGRWIFELDCGRRPEPEPDETAEQREPVGFALDEN
jgi:hypothetical protein